MRGRTNHGYAECRFTIHNRSSEQAHEVRLTMPDILFGRDIRVSRAAVVEPNGTVTLSLFQPPMTLTGHGVRVLVDGEEAESPRAMLPGHIPGYGYPGADERFNVLVSRSAREPVSDLEAATEVGATVAPPVKEGWSPNWLAYTRYDGIIVTVADLAGMSPPVRTALERYVEVGGTLLVLGTGTPPRGFCDPDGAADDGGDREVGFGMCLSARSWSGGDASVRFGHCIRRTFRPVGEPVSVAKAHDILPVVDNLNIPVRGMIVLMFGFVVLIGPVNLILLRWKRRRLLLFVTTPVLSLVTCTVLFGYAMFSEGISARYRLATLTLLDERQTRATSIGWLGYYSPLASRDVLRFSYQTELSPQFGSSGPYYGGVDEPVGLAVDWTEGQYLTGGWIRARMPVHFRVRKSERRRERLKIRRNADGLAVVNGLGADAVRLTVADFDNRLYTVEDLAAGAEAPLAARPGTPSGMFLREAYTRNWVRTIRHLAETPTSYLRPGTYVAVLDGNPFVEQGLAGATQRDCLTVVYGIMERGGDAGSR
jgi:hypothetical protein